MINQIGCIAINNAKAVLEETEYLIDMQSEDPIMYSGFGIHIICDDSKLYEKIKELKKFDLQDFINLCKCISLKAYARLLFDNEQYIEAFYCVKLAGYEFGNGTKAMKNDTDFQKFLCDLRKRQGKKGGINKGKNFAKPKKLALDYHDKYFANKDDKGNFIHTPPKTAESIIKELLEKGHHEINEYTVGSLANIIRKHRK